MSRGLGPSYAPSPRSFHAGYHSSICAYLSICNSLFNRPMRNPPLSNPIYVRREIISPLSGGLFAALLHDQQHTNPVVSLQILDIPGAPGDGSGSFFTVEYPTRTAKS